MEEAIFYIGQGNPQDKQSQESYGVISSLHTSKQFQNFRNADCSINGASVTAGNRLYVANGNKALINVYVFGKESIDQRMPVPEPITCLDVLEMNPLPKNSLVNEQNIMNLPNYKVPWLIVGGTKAGKVYIWEALSGNLLMVKDFHYQGVTKIKFSECGTFLVTSSEDSRAIVYKTIDLISVNEDNIKPYWIINDHTLPVTDFVITRGLVHDLNLVTVSKDSTLRVYNIMTKQLINTMVFSDPLQAVTIDPSYRNVYVASGGVIKIIPMFKVNNMTLERVGKFGEIITIKESNDITAHTSTITQLCISLDGMNLISGDEQGNICVSEITSTQVIRTFQLSSGISDIQVLRFPTKETTDLVDKKTRLLPPLKRVINDKNIKLSHEFYLELPNQQELKDQTIDQWIDEKAAEELDFKSSGIIVPVPAQNDDKLQRLSSAYSDLKSKYDELLHQHKDLLANQ